MLKRSFAQVAVVALAAALVVAPVGQTARAQTAQGATNFSISFPNVVVLHYFANLGMEISTSDLTEFLIGNTDGEKVESDATGVTISDASGTLTADANITPSALDEDVTAVTLHIQNAWAVRAVGTGTGNNVTMTFDSADSSLTGPGTTSMGASDYFVGTGTSAPTANTVSFAAPGLFTPQQGSISMELDLTNATQSGTYSGSWTLQVDVT